MTERMTPSRVLEEYDIVGRRIPKKLINEMREKFREGENSGEHIWRVLIDVDTSALESTMKTESLINDQVVYVQQAIAEVMIEKISHKNSRDGMSWKKRLEKLTSRKDFHLLFLCLSIPEKTWKSANKLQVRHYNLYVAISKRFNTNWSDFLNFMGIREEEHHGYWSKQVTACSSREDFLGLFARHEIPEEIWSNSSKLEKQFSGLRDAIKMRFNKNWSSFLGFMGIREEGRYGYWPKQVATCSSREDFLGLFARHEIPEEIWSNSSKLEKQYSGLCRVIKMRFNKNWSSFLGFMGIREEGRYGYWPKQVATCSSREDFLELFARHEIPEEIWSNSRKLKEVKSGLLDVIIKRYKYFGLFLVCMDGKFPFNGITSPTQAKDLLRQEVLRLRSSDTWIQKPTKGNSVTKAEWEEITKPEWYKNNPVVRAVADYLSSQKEEHD